jgi:hypothetical protein
MWVNVVCCVSYSEWPETRGGFFAIAFKHRFRIRNRDRLRKHGGVQWEWDRSAFGKDLEVNTDKPLVLNVCEVFSLAIRERHRE